MKICRETRRFD